MPSTEADYGQLMAAAEANDISWLWWDWYNPYGSENNLSRDGTAGHLTPTGTIVVNSHAASMANTAVLTCEGDDVFPSPPPPPPLPPPPPVLPATAPILSINAGGSADGSFLADRVFTGGSTAPRRTSPIDRSLVPAPAPPESVYQTERWGAATYRIPGLVARSTHSVALHFAEVYFTKVGQRKFNVSINGARVLSDFDIVAAAGASNRAIARTFTAAANASGEIVIDFTVGSADQPKVSGIVVR
jgi:Malectin domain